MVVAVVVEQEAADILANVVVVFTRILVFSFISASACVDDWIWLTYLLRSATMSYLE